MQAIFDAIVHGFNALTHWFSEFGLFFVDALATSLQTTIAYVVTFIIWLFYYVLHALFVVLQGLFALLPACGDVNPFTVNFANPVGQTTLEFIRWLLPVNAFAVMLGCAINVIFGYLTISWGLRWLKIIK